MSEYANLGVGVYPEYFRRVIHSFVILTPLDMVKSNGVDFRFLFA